MIDTIKSPLLARFVLYWPSSATFVSAAAASWIQTLQHFLVQMSVMDLGFLALASAFRVWEMGRLNILEGLLEDCIYSSTLLLNICRH